MWRTLNAEIHLKRGQGAARAGRFAVADAAYDRALEHAPDFTPALMYKAIGLGEAGALREALIWADRAVVLAPKRPAYRLVQGRLAYDAGFGDLAAEAFAAACRLSPTNRLAAAYGMLVRIRERLPHPEPSDLDTLEIILKNTNAPFQARWLVLCETALQSFAPRSRTLALQMIAGSHLEGLSRTPVLLYQRWWHGLRDLAGRASGLSAKQRAVRDVERRANARLKADDVDGAVDCLGQAMGQGLDDEGLMELYLDLCLFRGRHAPILQSIGDESEIEALEGLAARRTGQSAQRQIDAQIHQLTVLAIVRFHQGRAAEAISLFEAVAAGDPLDYLAPYFLGASHLAIHAPESARRWFEKAAAVINPEIACLRLREWRRCLT